MRNPHAGIQLGLRGAEVADDGDLVDEALVDSDVKEHCGAAAVLRQDDRPLGGMDLLKNCGSRRRVHPTMLLIA